MLFEHTIPRKDPGINSKGINSKKKTEQSFR